MALQERAEEQVPSTPNTRRTQPALLELLYETTF
eukprot:COSAG05_NODE_29_length_29038_cov_1237.466985_8_plen_34_part_00